MARQSEILANYQNGAATAALALARLGGQEFTTHNLSI
jgi:hypothetical protein